MKYGTIMNKDKRRFIENKVGISVSHLMASAFRVNNKISKTFGPLCLFIVYGVNFI